MSVPWGENKIEGIWLPKKDKSFRREPARAEIENKDWDACQRAWKGASLYKVLRQRCCQLEVRE